MEIEHIVVGVDGSDNARRALEWATGMARRLGSEVIAVHALGLLSRVDDGPPVPSYAHREQIRERFEHEWCTPLDDADVPNRRLVIDGNPVAVMLAVAEDEDADLVVMGSRGRGGFPELLLGSSSHQVAEHSRRPVVIIPPLHGADTTGGSPAVSRAEA